MSNRAADADAVRQLTERLRTIQMGGAPRILLAFDEGGVHIREVIEVTYRPPAQSKSGRTEFHYETYLIADGQDLTEAVKNARACNWTSRRE